MNITYLDISIGSETFASMSIRFDAVTWVARVGAIAEKLTGTTDNCRLCTA
ncbi:hypothetical protein [Pseudomonas kulmbachensis]|uniref:hypothetical protein n=1 Tax=Pseudomonas kulmbachensis TaxID=3043408 RepID=UPI002AB05E65|nr:MULTISPECIES: hypothetical protein [unclassified Pseudomonas]